MNLIIYIIAMIITFESKEIDINILYLSRCILTGCLLLSFSVDDCYSAIKKLIKDEEQDNPKDSQ